MIADSVHTAVFTAIVLLLAVLLWAGFADSATVPARELGAVPVRAVRWWLARRRWARAARVAWRAGADLTAGWTSTIETPAPPWWRTRPAATADPQPVPGSQPVCKCGGRRCEAHREGRECRWDREHEPAAYAAGRPLPRDGRHATVTAVVRWLAGGWGDSPLPIRLRRELGRLAGTTRVPAQLGVPGGRWLP